MPVFLSYRRSDSGGDTRAIYEELREQLGPEAVILDVELRQPGQDYVEKIRSVLGRCEHVLVIIGPSWLAAGPDGDRRIDDPDDTLRFEVKMALDSGATVIPVLVRDARMPTRAELPSDIQPLAYREAVEISDSRFDYDIQQLVQALGGGRMPSAAPAQAPAAPATGSLEGVLEGAWVVEIRNPFGQVQVMDLQLGKGWGGQQFQARNKMGPPWAAQGNWEILPGGQQLLMRGVQNAQFPYPQSGPYEAYVTFTSITPQRMTATTPANESITWSRAG
jgi:hypothetical protein